MSMEKRARGKVHGERQKTKVTRQKKWSCEAGEHGEGGTEPKVPTCYVGIARGQTAGEQ